MRAIQFIKAMKGQGLSKKGVEEILSIMDEKEGELATKADLEQVEKRLEASIDQLRTAGRQDIKQVRNELKLHRWIIGISVSAIVTAMIAGFAHLSLSISDTKEDIREIRSLILSQQASQAETDQASQ